MTDLETRRLLAAWEESPIQSIIEMANDDDWDDEEWEDEDEDWEDDEDWDDDDDWDDDEDEWEDEEDWEAVGSLTVGALPVISGWN